MIKPIHKNVKGVTPSLRARAGFTFIELVIVIAIIVIFAAILLPALNRAREQARYASWLHLRQSNRMDYRCVGYWSFEEGSGTTARNLALIGGGLHGVPEALNGIFPAALANRPTWVQANDPGERNRFFSKPSLRFDGNDFVEILHSASLNITGAITIEAWVRPTNVNGAMLLNKEGAYRLGDWEGLSGPQPVTARLGNNWPVRLTGTTNLTFEAWNHIVLTFDNGLASNQVKLYLNGRLDREITQSGVLPVNTNNVFIGSDSLGLIDEVAIFDVALSAEEIRKRYEMGRGR